MRVVLQCILALCARSTAALRLSPTPMHGSMIGRRAMVGVGSAALLFKSAPSSAAKDKGYMTMEEYQKVKQQALKDEKLYGLFESLRTRAGQTREFDSLAESDKLTEVRASPQ